MTKEDPSGDMMARRKPKDMKRLDVNLRQLKLAKAIVIDGKVPEDAILAAGYSQLTAAHDKSRIIEAALLKFQKKIQEITEKVGLTPDSMVRKCAKFIKAKRYRPRGRR